eukprot:m.152161 g.152161  ORF g.152161 m.152161 type:complete len:818 (+) comp30795_c4_seq2:283-2736(+)
MTTVIEECGYVGSCVVKESSVYAVSAAVGLLQIKLIKLNNKVVSKLAKSFKTKVVKDSPEYRQIHEKMLANGLDYTVGDRVRVEASYTDLHLVELANNTSTDFVFQKVIAHYVLPSKMSKQKDMALFVFVVDGKKLTAHVLQAPQDMAEHLNAEMGRLVAASVALSPYVLEVGVPSIGIADDENSITLGIGLHRTSDLAFSNEDKGKLQRKGTWNLKGKKGGNNAKRRSATYGASFKSFGVGAAPKVATNADIEENQELFDVHKIEQSANLGHDYREKQDASQEYQQPSEDDIDQELTKNIQELKLRGRSLSSDNLCEVDTDDLNKVRPDDDDAEDDDDDIEVEVFGFEGEGLDDDDVGYDDDPDGPVPPPPPRRSQATEAESDPIYMQPRNGSEDESDEESVTGFDDVEEDTYIPMWYHGRIGRTAAEVMLGSPQTPQGGFLIRDSDSSNVHLTMSIRNGNKVVHCRVIRNSKDLFAFQVCSMRKFIDKDGNQGGPWFKLLADLATEFTEKPIPTLFRPVGNKQLVPVKLSRKHPRNGQLDPRCTLMQLKNKSSSGASVPRPPPISSIPQEPRHTKAISGVRAPPAPKNIPKPKAKPKAKAAPRFKQVNFSHLAGPQKTPQQRAPPPIIPSTPRSAPLSPVSPRSPISSPKVNRKQKPALGSKTPPTTSRPVSSEIDDVGTYDNMNARGDQLMYATVQDIAGGGDTLLRKPKPYSVRDTDYTAISSLQKIETLKPPQNNNTDTIKSGTTFEDFEPSSPSAEYGGFGSEHEDEVISEYVESEATDRPIQDGNAPPPPVEETSDGFDFSVDGNATGIY